MKIRCRPLAIKNSAHLLPLLLKSFETFAHIMPVQKVTLRITYPQELEKTFIQAQTELSNIDYFVCLVVAILMIMH